MESCFAAESCLPPFIAILKYILHFFAAVFSGDAENQADSSQTACREKINRQAERMLSEYGNAVLRLAYSYLHSMADAEEVLQDALVQFLKTAPVLNTKEYEKAWLLHAAANLSKNRIKYNAVRQTDELSEELAAESRDDLSFVWEAVKALPAKYREVVHLFYYEGYQTAQIARILDMREATVRSNLFRGREKLKTILQEAYDFEQKI
ncbi:MAG: RNA polymerase sigma factor [Candidatus Heteroscillospira sp.]|jgi:RNA polymerase sigma factor (sigma-70 family)